ncbi:amidase [Candidatus Bathyarchaeota archaeon]|nr:amidase [Candidatus Bathyarchaeota archaeon]MBL7168821.1 amidase [Candidatus Bathyarchaeota archaeon]
MNNHKLSIAKASEGIRQREITPSELLESHLKRIERNEHDIRAWVTVDTDRAREAAARLTEESKQGQFRGPLHGVPVGVKDIYYSAGLRTTMGSPIYSDFIPIKDSAVVSALRDAGAIIIGKTETTDFAYTDPAPTRNPWNLQHTPGGSSSGSAAAVASGMCPLAFGSQTGGSIIRPAAFCGVVGVKPTYDLLSREGVYPLAWSLDHVGFFVRSVLDASLVLGALTGNEMPSLDNPLAEPPRIGLLRGFFQDHADGVVWEGFMESVDELREAGAQVVETPLPDSFSVVHSAHRLIMSSEAASVHQDNFRSRLDDYRRKLRGLVASGLLVPASAYLRAQRIKGLFIEEVRRTLKGLDCLITPSAPTPALLGLESTGDAAFNSPWSLTGFPSITVPSALTKDGLPLGIQLVNLPYQEEVLLRTALWCEEALGSRLWPPDYP